MASESPATVTTTTEAAAQGTERWDEAVDRYRDVAKWLIAAFGAIGAVIAGTAPLAGIGDLQPERLGYLMAGAAVALTGVVVVLAATITILVPRAVYRSELRAQNQGPFRRTFVGLGRFENLLAEHPEDLLPAGITNIDDLGVAITNLRTTGTRTAAKAASVPADDPSRRSYQRAADAIVAASSRHQMALNDLLRVAGYEKARTRFHQAVLAVLAGGVAAAAGLALTLYGIGSGPADAPTPGPILSDPSPVTVSLTPVGVQMLQPRLGSGCDGATVPALLIAGDRTDGPWDIVTLPRTGCSVIRVTVTPEVGTVG